MLVNPGQSIRLPGRGEPGYRVRFLVALPQDESCTRDQETMHVEERLRKEKRIRAQVYRSMIGTYYALRK